MAEAVAAIEFMIDDLVWTRTGGFSCATVVEGHIKRLYPNVGETQGGLFSALRYVVAKAIGVDRYLAMEFPNHVMRSIVDDGILQCEVRTPEDVRVLVAWMCWRLDVLVTGADRPAYSDAQGEYDITGSLGKLNFSKFKILQHPDACGTGYDMESVRTDLPFEDVSTASGPQRKYPTVVRDVLEFNGAAIGFDVEARKAHVMQEVGNLDERTARLVDVAGVLGRQKTEMYGRISYRASSVLMHQMRAVPPSVAGEAMGQATQQQLRLLRTATGATAEMLGGAMEELNGTASARACACRCSITAHMPTVMGGGNWPEPRLIQPLVHAAAKVDTFPTIATMADMQDYPHPAEWLTCSVPALREAAEVIKSVTAMRGFHVRPPGDAEAWERVHRELIGPANELLWHNLPTWISFTFRYGVLKSIRYLRKSDTVLSKVRYRTLWPFIMYIT